jgi:hypothetical protein
MFEVSDGSFLELPEALLEELLSRCGDVSNDLFTSFKKIYDDRSRIRRVFMDRDILHKDSEISSLPANPTTCGIDGAFAVERARTPIFSYISNILCNQH